MRLVRQCYVEVSYGGGEMPLLDNEGQSPLLLLTYLFFRCYSSHCSFRHLLLVNKN